MTAPPDPPAPWHVLAASVRGTSHERSGTPCQDAHGWVVTPGGALAAAVSDGAGSSPRSDEGARWAVDAALRTL
ncbi:MAG TPA: protein phosphatase 2C domain-containing protein, partial [Longimicrobium sp.]|nr:protein phosphatase 2C domain-containing protein [Longimicrobium sp.]